MIAIGRRILAGAAALAVLLAGAAWLWAARQPKAASDELGLVLADAEEGALVLAVMPDSAADRMGLAPGDRLIAIDGASVAEEGPAEGCFTRIQDGCTLTLERGGRRFDRKLGR